MKKSISLFKSIFAISAMILVLSDSVYAQKLDIVSLNDVSQAISIIKAEEKKVIEGFEHGDMAPLLQRALNALINNGNQQLHEKHFEAAAAKFSNEWSRFYSRSLIGYSPYNLGDHKPLFDWLADYYDTLEHKLGKQACVDLHLNDIKAINFGAPVVISPRDSTTHEIYDVTEYRKHFVPFSTAVLYWSMRITCSSTLKSIPSFICSSVAEMPRDGYESFIAPYLSDYVYSRTTKSMARAN